MSWPVSHAYWHFWRPGMRVEIAEGQDKMYDRYISRAGKRNSDHRVLLLALALDANPKETITGESEVAECYTSIDNLSERVQRSGRTVQRLLQELKRWQEIEIEPCHNRCMQRGHKGTNHYYLPLPDGAQPWKRFNRKEAREYAKTRQPRRK